MNRRTAITTLTAATLTPSLLRGDETKTPKNRIDVLGLLDKENVLPNEYISSLFKRYRYVDDSLKGEYSAAFTFTDKVKTHTYDRKLKTFIPIDFFRIKDKYSNHEEASEAWRQQMRDNIWKMLLTGVYQRLTLASSHHTRQLIRDMNPYVESGVTDIIMGEEIWNSMNDNKSFGVTSWCEPKLSIGGEYYKFLTEHLEYKWGKQFPYPVIGLNRNNHDFVYFRRQMPVTAYHPDFGATLNSVQGLSLFNRSTILGVISA